MFLIVGLGNPGEEYKVSRHNTGWIVLDNILGKVDWKESSGTKALYHKEKIGKTEIEYFKPQTFMNNSGVAVSFAQTKHKLKPEYVVVIYDDIDLPLGSLKISYNRSSGGHNGVESIIKKLKSKEFIRIRVGISKETPSGKIKKPRGEEAVVKYLMGKFKEDELKELKKVSKKVAEILRVIVTEGKDKAMCEFN